ncbi:MAG: thermonuclease family protein [Polyangiales bacterium]
MLRGNGIQWLVACVLVAGCGRGATADRRDPQAAEPHETKTSSATPRTTLHEGLIIGEFRLPPNAVVDGDTIRVEGLDGSVRLLGVDSEEKIRSRRDRVAIEKDFRGYLKGKRGNHGRPAKAATPLGDQASAFGEAFFGDAETVRLERDDPMALRGRFGRALAYAFVNQDGKWVSYNVELVRVGLSPYFTKYGYSHRFHNQFARAEQEARDAKRGIWDPSGLHYDDYEERKAWWDARARFIQAFDHDAASSPDYVLLTHANAESAMAARIGQEVTVLGTVDEIQYFKGLVRVFLAGADREDFPIIFRDRGVFERSGIREAIGEPITVRGVVERYTKGDYTTLQIVVRTPEQVRIAEVPPPRRRQATLRENETGDAAGR